MRVQTFDLTHVIGRNFVCNYSTAPLGSRLLHRLKSIEPVYGQQSTKHGTLYSIGEKVDINLYTFISPSLLKAIQIDYPTSSEEAEIQNKSKNTVVFDATCSILYSFNPNLLYPKVEHLNDLWDIMTMEIVLCNQ
jgi:hypothetical protein